jgi:uncharacterized protein YndB with AHSA1/START domain
MLSANIRLITLKNFSEISMPNQKSPVGASIDYEIVIHAQPEKVFETLTTSAGWDAWLTDGTFLDASPGGELRFRWGNTDPEMSEAVTDAAVLEVIAPRRFSFRWLPQGIEIATTVTFEMTATAEGTQLSLHEESYPETAAGMQALAVSAGMWAQALTLLKDYLEG